MNWKGIAMSVLWVASVVVIYLAVGPFVGIWDPALCSSYHPGFVMLLVAMIGPAMVWIAMGPVYILGYGFKDERRREVRHKTSA